MRTYPDYTNWCTPADVVNRLSEMGYEASDIDRFVSGPRIQIVIDAVARHIQQYTHRQFVPSSAEEARYYDGSGTGEMEIDEYVSFSSVEVIGYVETAVVLQLSNVAERDDNTYPKTRIVIRRGTPTGTFVYIDRFPKGRQNIIVTGIFGYNATIPADLWNAHEGDVAARIARRLISSPDGRVKSWEQGGVKETYDMTDPGDITHSTDELKACLALYKKPLQTLLRKARPVMV